MIITVLIAAALSLHPLAAAPMGKGHPDYSSHGHSGHTPINISPDHVEGRQEHPSSLSPWWNLVTPPSPARSGPASRKHDSDSSEVEEVSGDQWKDRWEKKKARVWSPSLHHTSFPSYYGHAGEWQSSHAVDEPFFHPLYDHFHAAEARAHQHSPDWGSQSGTLHDVAWQIQQHQPLRHDGGSSRPLDSHHGTASPDSSHLHDPHSLLHLERHLNPHDVDFSHPGGSHADLQLDHLERHLHPHDPAFSHSHAPLQLDHHAGAHDAGPSHAHGLQHDPVWQRGHQQTSVHGSDPSHSHDPHGDALLHFDHPTHSPIHGSPHPLDPDSHLQFHYLDHLFTPLIEHISDASHHLPGYNPHPLARHSPLAPSTPVESKGEGATHATARGVNHTASPGGAHPTSSLPSPSFGIHSPSDKTGVLSRARSSSSKASRTGSPDRS